MLRRTYIGLDICPDGLKAAAIQWRGRQICLVGGQTLNFSDGVISPSASELNVLDPDLFVENLRDVLIPLAKTEERVAVALPDAAGATFLLDVETPLKSRQQSLEILKWQLKDMMPEGYRDFTLDYQILSHQESGAQRVLVSTIDTQVLRQYEELIVAAGLHAVLIDFHSFLLYNCYRSKTELGDDFILVATSGQEFILLGFTGKVLDFYRVTQVGYDPEKVFRELNRSLVSYRNDHPGQSRLKVYLHTDWLEQDQLLQAVRTAFDAEVQLLPDALKQVKGDARKLTLSTSESAGMAAALGAAERLLDKVI